MSRKLKKTDDIRVVVGLDFGTTFSGFTYCHVEDKENLENMSTNVTWPGQLGQLKTNTVLEYDDDLREIVLWGYPALAKRPSRKKEKNQRKNIVELFKLHLGNLPPDLRDELSVDYKKAITDYLREIGKCIEETIDAKWNGIKLENVLFILSVPAEYDDIAIRTMRECMYNAELIGDDLYTERLQFTTEPEAAAIYCMDNLKEHDLFRNGTTFMIVDCGGGTVDLTTRKLLNNKQLGEVTERTGGFYGSTFIDRAFKNYLRRKLGKDAIDSFEKEQYGQLQYIVQEFCENAKLPFTGDDTSFNYELDLEDFIVLLEDYVSDGDVKKELENDENLIKFDYEAIKSMFDPIVENIITLIRNQLNNSREKGSTPSIMFLVGGFSESNYLQKRIKDEFRDHVNNISVPQSPTAAISRGAAMYGLSLFSGVDLGAKKAKGVIGSRVLKHTYGVDVLRPWDPRDPQDRVGLSIFGPSTLYFNAIAKRGTVAKVDDKFPIEGLTVSPCHPYQDAAEFEIYYTREYDAKFSHETGMKLLGKLKIDWPGVGLNRSVTFRLSFCEMEITATATNDLTGQNYHTYFEINTES
ncbi:hypothetical protein RclHR1_15260006 [Rhizophagus clarus]|uniref:Actin-like ATPase domain-containing protein n=1 Tax=Rhizophagus clarus TaxID=94130 RepID=A0A2Z6R7C5_9GLOM|nr:hypothetical protein RclHR1_15260006 [Rhizophagus clarus]GES97294.1 hypothetical protein GLOIN_2v1716518 [Rhizophagus clarus]